MREHDTPDLFGRGVGISTTGNATCHWCGTRYTHREGPDGEGTGESIGVTDFGAKQILDCCWEEVERAVLDRMADILPWYGEILKRQEALLAKRRTLLEAVTKP